MPFSSPKSWLNSEIGRMRVDVESTTRRGWAEASGPVRNRSTKVPMSAWSPSPTPALGTLFSLTLTPLVDSLS